MSEIAYEKTLKLYSHLLKEVLEFRKLIEEKKKEVRPGMLGKGSVKEFKRYKLEAYEQ
ncbi:hypothetical protein [Thermococcus barophilus]|uniref:Uncharacterized protein n=1 Tax=Thermococcus barophilus TaxID=55802 RepID=A0A0S1XA00_THEBA|nr:hypothetical protein [Thermococcus barophilus]ALM74591.1 hypothetical protein TBCH5v1_0631 [Thermococcus barophilus]